MHEALSTKLQMIMGADAMRSSEAIELAEFEALNESKIGALKSLDESLEYKPQALPGIVILMLICCVSGFLMGIAVTLAFQAWF
jgi:hypothetical protein